METEIRKYPDPKKPLKMTRPKGQLGRALVPYLLGNKKHASQAREGAAEQAILPF